MDAVVDRMSETAGTPLDEDEVRLGLNGLLSSALGVAILVWPNISVYALTIVFGAYGFRGRSGTARPLGSAAGDGRGRGKHLGSPAFARKDHQPWARRKKSGRP